MPTEEAFVISDLHLGGGAAEPELEDFRQDDQLAAFVDSIAGPGVTLFLNGDFIDFPQIPPYPEAPASHLLWDEATSLAKARTATEQHPKPFEALGRFVAAGGAVRIHAGNHDLDVAWPAVQSHLRVLLGGPADAHLSFGTSAVFHGVLVEHGHMFTPENATRSEDAFVHEWPAGSGLRYLEKVWGTDFMLRWYNGFERTHPYADNVKPILTVFYHGIKNGWVRGRDVVRLLAFLASRGVPLSAVSSAVLAGEGPEPADVVGMLAEARWQEAVNARMDADPAFLRDVTEALAELPASDRALLGAGGPVDTGLAEPGLGAPAGATLGLLRDDRETRAASDRLGRPGVTHVVFGHTHHPVHDGLGGHHLNPGTWLPRLDVSSPLVRAKIKAAGGLTREMLTDPSLYVTEPLAAHIVPDAPHQSRVSLVRVP